MVDSPGKVTLWGIEVFAAIAEERSISAAARRLDVSPSSVSQQLSNLEQALGARLVDRTARPVSLTQAGALFQQRARAILQEAAEARAELAMRDLSRLTRFNLGVIEDFDADVTPALLSAMAEDMPETRLLLETGPSHRLYDLLETGALDVIVAAETGPPAPWMEVHPILEEPFVAAVPKGALDGAGDPLARLQELPLIQYTARHVMGRQIAGHLSRQNLLLSHRFELDSYHAIMALVAGGAGWTILTPLGVLKAGRFRDSADLVPLPFEAAGRRISLTARRETLQDLPDRAARRLRLLLDQMIVGPARTRMPWLGDRLRVL